MKKTILSVSLALAAMLALVGCGKGSGTMDNVDGVSIAKLDGRDFDKSEMMGKTIYVAQLNPKDGFAANVNILFDANKGTLPTMDEYVKISMSQYNTLNANVQVLDKTDSVGTLSGTMGKVKIYQRLLRDPAKNRFIVVTGSYMGDSEKATIETCVNSAGL